MKSLKQYSAQMDQLLEELIAVATQLRDMSLKVISEEDLSPLQKHQEELLAKLEGIDQKIKANYPHQISNQLQEKVHTQLEVFQKLNQEFIENVNNSQGLIQFELKRLKSEPEGDISNLLRRKMST